MNIEQLKNLSLYIGVAMLMTHELDAVMNQEWRVLPLTSWLDPEVGYQVFLWAHVPLFALFLGALSNSSEKIRTVASKVLAAFLIIHSGLHLAFSTHENYEFTSFSSNLLIYGGAIYGLIYITLTMYTAKK